MRALILFFLFLGWGQAGAAVLYAEDFGEGYPGWWIGPPAHRPFVSVTLDGAGGGAAIPALRLDAPPATLNYCLASPAMHLPRLDADYTIEFSLRLEFPDSPFQASLLVQDSLGTWLYLTNFLNLAGENMAEMRRFRYSFHAGDTPALGSCVLLLGLPYLKVYREGRFWLDDVTLREGKEANPLEMYLSPTSVAAGATVGVHLSCGRGQARLRVFREGSSQVPLESDRLLTGLSVQPVPAQSYRVGCGWPVGAEIQTGADWPSGAYVVKVDDGDRSVWAPFVVRGHGGEGKVVIELPTHTDQAYNAWGGRSFYTGPAAPEVSFERPTPSSLYSAPIHMIRWLEREQIPYAVITDDDLHYRPELIRRYQGLVLTWHGEYWTRVMREGVEDYIRDGGSVISFSGNTCWWQTRVEGEHTLVCYKYSVADDPYQIIDPSLVTNHWDEPPLDDPPTRFLGLSWREGGMVNWETASSCPCAWDWLDGNGGYTVDEADHWIFDGTSLYNGALLGHPYAIVGYEVDGAPVSWTGDRPQILPEGGTPGDFRLLGHARCFNQYRADSTGIAIMGIMERGDSFVFNGGTTGWCWGLPQDPLVQQVTRNLIDRLPDRLPVSPPGRLLLYPNPARESVSLEVTGQPALRPLGVYDLAGRRVAMISPRRHFSWRIGDAAGRDLPSGAYWIVPEGGKPVRFVHVR
jgi:hypothetical protein